MGTAELTRSLRTKDRRTTNVCKLSVLSEWHQKFDELRRRRDMTEADFANATWEQYTSELRHDDLARALIEASVQGERPVHFVEHDGPLAIFFDGSGAAQIVHEHDWLGGEIEGHNYAAPALHHGVAVQVGNHVIISEPNAEDPSALPVGIRVLDRDGEPMDPLHACPDLHGEASSGDMLAHACATGLLIVKEGTEAPSIELLPHSPALPEGKSPTLLGGVGTQYFLGNYGADRVAIIEPGADAPFRLVNLQQAVGDHSNGTNHAHRSACR